MSQAISENLFQLFNYHYWFLVFDSISYLKKIHVTAKIICSKFSLQVIVRFDQNKT